MIVTDGINAVLESDDSDACLIYPIDWSYDAIDVDSTSSIDYLLSYGRRIGLDFLITERLESVISGQYTILLAFYDIRMDSCIHTMVASFNSEQPDDFFRRVAHRSQDLFSVYCDTLFEPDLPEKTTWQEYGWGRYHQIHGDFFAAAKAYRDGIVEDSTHISTKIGLSDVLLQKAYQRKKESKFAEDLFIEAAKLLRQIVKTDSANARAHRLLGQLYIQSERWNKAEHALNRALKYQKEDPFVYFHLSRLHPSRYAGSGFKNKEQLLRHALTLNPAFERARLALGEELYFRNKYQKTEKEYLKMLSIHPRSLDALLALGKLYVVRNDVLNIIRIYQRVLDIVPNSADAFYNLGIAYYNDEKTDEAVGFFQKAIEMNNHVDSHFYLGVIHAERGDKDRAVEYLRKRIRLRQKFDDPFAEEARKYLAQLISDG